MFFKKPHINKERVGGGAKDERMREGGHIKAGMPGVT